jgi:uncharacterized protein (DUF362 family)
VSSDEENDMKSAVAIVREGSVDWKIKNALDLLGGPEEIINGNRILIKPNLGPWSVGTIPGYVNRWATTKVETVAAMTKLLKDMGIAEVIVADGGFIGYDVTAQFKESGMKEAVEKAGGKVIDLDKGEFEKRKLTEDAAAEISKTVLEADFVVNMPIMKTHMWTKVSLGIKNLKGTISPNSKRDFHRKDVGTLLANLCREIKPQLTIVDGLVGYEGLGPSVFGTPKKLDLIVAGTDPVAVDTVSAEIMGHDVKEIDYIKIAAELGLGEIDLDKIEILGVKLDEVKTTFEPSPLGAHHMVNMLGIAGLRYFGWEPGDVKSECSGCIGNIAAALAAIRSDTNEIDRDLDIVVGPRDLPQDIGENVLLYGNCQARYKSQGSYLPGCPPNIKDTYTKIAKLSMNKKRFMTSLMKRIFKGESVKPLEQWERYKDVV